MLLREVSAAIQRVLRQWDCRYIGPGVTAAAGQLLAGEAPRVDARGGLAASNSVACGGSSGHAPVDIADSSGGGSCAKESGGGGAARGSTGVAGMSSTPSDHGSVSKTGRASRASQRRGSDSGGGDTDTPPGH